MTIPANETLQERALRECIKTYEVAASIASLKINHGIKREIALKRKIARLEHIIIDNVKNGARFL